MVALLESPVALTYRVAYPATPLANPRPRTQFVDATRAFRLGVKASFRSTGSPRWRASVEARNPGLTASGADRAGVRTLGGTRNIPGTPSVGRE
jgi:hypothetical protein